MQRRVDRSGLRGLADVNTSSRVLLLYVLLTRTLLNPILQGAIFRPREVVSSLLGGIPRRLSRTLS